MERSGDTASGGDDSAGGLSCRRQDPSSARGRGVQPSEGVKKSLSRQRLRHSAVRRRPCVAVLAAAEPSTSRLGRRPARRAKPFATAGGKAAAATPQFLHVSVTHPDRGHSLRPRGAGRAGRNPASWRMANGRRQERVFRESCRLRSIGPYSFARCVGMASQSAFGGQGARTLWRVDELERLACLRQHRPALR